MAINRLNFNTGPQVRPVSAIEQAGSIISKYLEDKDKRDRLAVEQAWQDKIRGRQEAEWARQDEARKQEELLSNKLADAMQNRTTSKQVTTQDQVLNKDERDLALGINSKVAARNQKVLGDRQTFADQANKRMNEILAAREGRYGKAAEALDKQILDTQQAIQENEAQSGVLGIPADNSMLNNRLKALQEARSNIKLRDEDYLAAHKQAMAETEGAGAFDRRLLNKMAVPEAQIKKGGTRTVTSEMSKDQWTKNALKSVLSDPNITGKNRLAALSMVKNQAELLYGKDKDKSLTFDQALKLQKYKDEQAGTKSDLEGYFAAYPDMPKGIKSVSAAKSWVDSRDKLLGKKKESKDTLTESISKVRTDAGIFNFNINNEREDALNAVNAVRSKYSDAELSAAVKAATDEDGGFDKDIFTRYLKQK